MTLVKADGTQITKTAGNSLIESVTDPDPKVKVTEAVYELSTPSGTKYPPIIRQLKFRADQIIPRSKWDACWATATISSVAPATGAAAGGTAITIKGSGFTPGSTVAIGGVACTSVAVISDGKITCATGAHAAGAVNVVVTTDAGAVTKTGGFTYT
jgi:hypothetical protein